jgi:hypothetical protein
MQTLFEVVEEKLPHGALSWQEVTALNQFRSQEKVLMRGCKFKKLTGDSGDPARDEILYCQWIYVEILEKSA